MAPLSSLDLEDNMALLMRESSSSREAMASDKNDLRTAISQLDNSFDGWISGLPNPPSGPLAALSEKQRHLIIRANINKRLEIL